MSQEHSSTNEGNAYNSNSITPTESTQATNANSVVEVSNDCEDDDVVYVGLVRPGNSHIPDGMVFYQQPSTSAAAAAAAAATGSNSVATANVELKTSNAETPTATGEAAVTGATAAVLDCPICLQTCIHPARLPCGHIFCFLCVKGVAYKNRRCAMCRREIPPEFLDHPQLVNGIDDICVTRATEDGYQWYYEGRNGWWQYDDRTSQDLEEAFKKGEKSCTILVAGYVYIVDLEAMLQQRQNEPTRCRRVKRDLATIPKKGVAGLRIEGNTVTTDTNFAAQQSSGTQRLRNSQTNSQTSTPAVSFISNLAATGAAIRIANDIIGSTLAHADELTRGLTASNISDSAGDLSGEHTSNNLNPGPQQSLAQGTTRSLASSHSNSTQDLMRSVTEDLLDTTQQVIETNQYTIDLFEQALNDFQALAMRDFVDSSDEENVDEETEAGESTDTQLLPPSLDRNNDDNGGLGF